MTPGAVSRQIKSLEQETGCALFERVHRGVVLTSAGEELFNVLSTSFGQWSDVFKRHIGAKQESQRHGGGDHGICIAVADAKAG